MPNILAFPRRVQAERMGMALKHFAAGARQGHLPGLPKHPLLFSLVLRDSEGCKWVQATLGPIQKAARNRQVTRLGQVVHVALASGPALASHGPGRDNSWRPRHHCAVDQA